MTSDLISFSLLLIAVTHYIGIVWSSVGELVNVVGFRVGAVSQGTRKEESCIRLGGGLDSLVKSRGRDSTICRQLY